MEKIDSKEFHSHPENIFRDGLHICHIYNNDEERIKTMAKFYLNGLSAKDRILCIVDTVSPHDVKGELQNLGVDIPSLSNTFFTTDSESSYCPNGTFEADAVLEGIRDFWNQAHQDGFSGARVSGDMSWILRKNVSLASIMEYETRVLDYQKICSCPAVCEYDARKFDGALIMDVLAVHPVMLIRGQVIKNPYFIPPKEFMAQFYARPN